MLFLKTKNVIFSLHRKVFSLHALLQTLLIDCKCSLHTWKWCTEPAVCHWKSLTLEAYILLANIWPTIPFWAFLLTWELWSSSVFPHLLLLKPFSACWVSDIQSQSPHYEAVVATWQDTRRCQSVQVWVVAHRRTAVAVDFGPAWRHFSPLTNKDL